MDRLRNLWAGLINLIGSEKKSEKKKNPVADIISRLRGKENTQQLYPLINDLAEFDDELCTRELIALYLGSHPLNSRTGKASPYACEALKKHLSRLNEKKSGY